MRSSKNVKSSRKSLYLPVASRTNEGKASLISAKTKVRPAQHCLPNSIKFRHIWRITGKITKILSKTGEAKQIMTKCQFDDYLTTYW